MTKLFATLAISAALLVGPQAYAQTEDYGTTVGNKALSGISNIALCWVELPKNVINTSNQVNLLFGATGGLVKGVAHMVGRVMTGTADLLTAPIPTQPITRPQFVWQDFSSDTQYGPIFKPTN
ncbi:exosortase system-associated protein, TIGR04073 family [Methylococcus sp. EFPC2]|uniref:exosortase system-associated protein, TIGR04073 family n=1 Tax=Methylococcus sp. EFPC2 TaxID=2812648 RepID=UPI0019689D3B|nr:exosortase system-associated protein, TIGR04073 family [Methylococcus sp. EFPC2]QSA98789.1 exosortase system-associated protein, TIGR04073 family [Methylococcus sp. EFPC2]